METTTAAPPSDVKTPGNIVSAGAPVIAKIQTQQAVPDENAGAAGDAGADLTEEQKLAAAEAEKNKVPDLTDEQLKSYFEKQGIKFEGIEHLKKKFEPDVAAAAPEDVAAVKAKEEAAFEKRMLDFFVDNGGKVEDFVNLKTVASADLKALSEVELIRELKAANFDEDEIKLVLKERYYQINPEELEQGEEETTDDYAKRKALLDKKIAYGSKKFESKASHIKKQSEDALGILRNAIKEQDLQKQNEALISSKVDEIALTLPRKLTFELGMVNDQKIDPVTYDVADADVAEVVNILKNSEVRNKLLFNEDNSLNLSSIGNILLRNKILESSVKASLLEGGNREVAKFEKIFPGRTAKEIGVGGNNGSASGTGRKGVLVSAGKPEPVRRNT